jgi:nucleoside-diphosphate-sugar epimerase
MTGQRVLVTGGFGYVGSRLTPFLLDRGHFVRVIDLNLYGDYGLEALQTTHPGLGADKFEFLRADIRDPQAVEKAMKGIDAVIHLAAISNDPTGEVDETLTRQVNFDAVGLLVASAKKAGVKRFINASSSSVFGIKNDPDVSEALEPEPLTFYSKYKALAEWVVLAASSPEFCTVNIRPATICGFSARQRFDLTVNKLTADALQKKIITVHGGEQRRPNVGMTDVINLYANLLEVDSKKINGKTFNFGFENLKVIEIAKLIQKELSDFNVEIKVTATQDNRDYHISSKKILGSLEYKPVSSIANEVKNLRVKIEKGLYGDIDAPQYYNMKTMKLSRNAGPYNFLSH